MGIHNGGEVIVDIPQSGELPVENLDALRFINKKIVDRYQVIMTETKPVRWVVLLVGLYSAHGFQKMVKA